MPSETVEEIAGELGRSKQSVADQIYRASLQKRRNKSPPYPH
jgi:hypothetical protein